MKSNVATIVCLLALGLLTLSFAATFVYAADPASPSSLTQIGSSRRDLSTQPVQTIGAQGGNVTEISIHALTITQSWQGYYGNVTGTVTLQDSRNYTFYNWSAASPTGEVYATRNSSVSWTAVNCTTSGNRTLEETYLGQSATDPDSVTNTFNAATHPQFSVGANTIYGNTCYTTYGYVGNNTQTSNFVMLMLNSRSDVIYTTIINNSVTGFDSRAHDFELLVAENEKSGSLGATPYYFFVELG
jgi:hypothetical protein